MPGQEEQDAPEPELVDPLPGAVGRKQQRRGEAGNDQRQQDQEEDDEEAAEQLAARAAVVERLAVDAHRRPDALAHLRLAPEMVDAERENAQDAVEDAQAQEAARRVHPADGRHVHGARRRDCRIGDGHNPRGRSRRLGKRHGWPRLQPRRKARQISMLADAARKMEAGARPPPGRETNADQQIGCSAGNSLPAGGSPSFRSRC